MKTSELGKRVEYLEKENEHLSDVVDLLMRTISSREDEIRELLETVKKFEKSSSRVEHEKFRVPFTKANSDCTFSGLSPFARTKIGEIGILKKDVVESSTNFSEKPNVRGNTSKIIMFDEDAGFSSRFMPNVKFKITEDEAIWIYTELLKKQCLGLVDATECWTETDETGMLIVLHRDENDCQKRIVSKYVAVPRLIPDGMVYDKESNSLVEEESLRGLTISSLAALHGSPNVPKHLASLLYKEKGSFNSGFMPNVKFVVNADDVVSIYEKYGFYLNKTHTHYKTNKDGNWLKTIPSSLTYDAYNIKEVSKYLAVPSLIPKGMVYDKESDSLVKKVCANQMCQGEFCDCDDSHSFTAGGARPSHLKSELPFVHVFSFSDGNFAKELSKVTAYTIIECLGVIRDYGSQNARAVLGLMASGIDASAFKLKKD